MPVTTRPPPAEAKAATKAEESRAAAPASRLCDDLLLEIFLRLPSVATLVRAACTCAAWRRAVASSPDFRRRFRSLHSLPLLGLFTADAASIVATSPTFVSALPHVRDDDLAAAVRGGDFSLPAVGCWEVISNSCRLGNLLLYNREAKSLAAINPFTRQSQRVVPPHHVSKNIKGYFVGVILLSSEEDDGPRVMLVDCHGSKIKATVFSMDTGEVCSATPWVDVPASPPDQHAGRVLFGMAVQLNGSVYYLVENSGYIASIDTATMGIAVIEMPPCVRRSFCVGETKDGATCLVYTDGLKVGVLMHTRDAAGGVQKWVLDRVVSMDSELQRALPGEFDVLHVFQVRDGYAYLSASATRVDPGERYWILYMCLATMKLEKLFQGTYGGRNVIPYIMPWPRSLIGW